MPVVAGQGGEVEFASGYAVKIDTWSITASAAELDITGFEDADANGNIWRSFMGGVKEWRGTYSGKLDSDTSFITGLGGTAAAATFYFDNSTDDTEINGSIVIIDAEVTVSIGSVQTVSFTFVGSGVPTVQSG